MRLNHIWTILLIVITFSAVMAQTMPESPHPYPDKYNKTEEFSIPGAKALELTFSSETCTEEGKDFITLTTGKQELGKFSGNVLAGLRFMVEGDTIHIRLTSDEMVSAYGYKIIAVRPIFESRSSPVEVDYGKCETMSEDDLKSELYNLVKDHTCLYYTPARQKMFGEIDNENGYVECVYTGILVKTTTIPDANVMNTEHTWPKSLGAENEPAKSDLNHLFPTDEEANNRRSSYPFGTVSNVTWSKSGSCLGTNSSGTVVFTPRSVHRGNVARAMFYFAIRYKKSIDAAQESVLKQWHKDDPVDNEEILRNDAISTYQKTRNPFIDHPEYVDRISDF